jgi:hypothetical protein
VDFVEAAKYSKLAADERDGHIDSMVAYRYARIIETGPAAAVKYYDVSAKTPQSTAFPFLESSSLPFPRRIDQIWRRRSTLLTASWFLLSVS